MRYLVLILCLLPGMLSTGCPGSCVSPNTAIHAAESAGFTKPVVSGKHFMYPSFYGCSKSDSVAFEMTAVNHLGKRVSFTMCCGWLLKACTPRFGVD